MKDSIVLYHGHCPDGFGAALAAWMALGDTADYVPCLYNEEIPAVAGKHVYILDFSFEPEVTLEMSRQAKSLVMLDHHKTAYEKLHSLKPLCCGKLHFDMGHSGAVLAWHHFHPGKDVPYLLQCIQARDIWTWDVEGAKEFLRWLDSQPRNFESWLGILNFDERQLSEAKKLGTAMQAMHDSMCEAVFEGATPVTLAGETGLMLNASFFFTNDVGSRMAEESGTFGLVWRVDDKRVRCSLRSVKPYNVRTIAEKFGGGGHDQAAAFELPIEALPKLISEGILHP